MPKIYMSSPPATEFSSSACLYIIKWGKKTLGYIAETNHMEIIPLSHCKDENDTTKFNT